MIHANKAGEEQITKESQYWISQTRRVCFTVYVCAHVCVYKATQGSKRMIQLRMKDRMKTSEEPFQPVSIIFTAVALL